MLLANAATALKGVDSGAARHALWRMTGAGVETAIIVGKLKLSKAEDKQLVASGLASVLETVKDEKTRKAAEKLHGKYTK